MEHANRAALYPDPNNPIILIPGMQDSPVVTAHHVLDTDELVFLATCPRCPEWHAGDPVTQSEAGGLPIARAVGLEHLATVHDGS